MRKLKRTVFIVLASIGIFILGLMMYVRLVSGVSEPGPLSSVLENQERIEVSEHFYTLGQNWFKKSNSGLYELYVEGDPFDRGVAIGKLTQELVQFQESTFNRQINRLVPSSLYRIFLKYFVGWFNRDLEDNVNDEYKLEIFGVAQSASHDFDGIASPYQRLLNYHAAHDIGHALQNMALVGCTSFATWGSKSEDGSLIIGRNFDFYVGEEFARDKIVAFYNPTNGHKFMMVTFGGMTGVLSGMNDQGLTVTINAAKSEVPTASATPVSLVAREILQYASTIDEAYAIAAKRKMFVAESFLIGSAKDGKAASIEKTPENIDLVEPKNQFLISTNHFQGKVLGNTELNINHVNSGASAYRYNRVAELLTGNIQNSVSKTASILRDQRGLMDADIGLGNEKSINQLVAHHSIIFQPEKNLVWVSTSPWQLGKYVCYNLNTVFSTQLIQNTELVDAAMEIPPDPFLVSPDYNKYVKFSKFRFPFDSKSDLNPDSLITWNPQSYLTYMLAGNYYYEAKEFGKAAGMYEQGMTKEIATQHERVYMQKNLQLSKEKVK